MRVAWGVAVLALLGRPGATLLGEALAVQSSRLKGKAPVQEHTLVRLHIERLNNLGQGVARLADGFVVCVPFVVPGEVVDARVTKVKPTFAVAEVTDIVEPSADRCAPVCPYFEACGGCQYQHMTLEAQRRAKRTHVRDCLERIGRFPNGTPVVDAVRGGASAYGYRSKLTPHFVPPGRGAPLDMGFFHHTARQTIVDVPRCVIASDAVNARLTTLREETRAKYQVEAIPRKGATLLLRQNALGGVATDPKAVVEDHVGGLSFSFRAGEFFQNNPEALPALVAHVTREASDEGQNRHLVDCYCGGGLFAICGARLFDSVRGLEISKENVASAEANARRNGIKNAKFLAGDAEAIFHQVVVDDEAVREASNRTAVVLDPPRKGCSESFLRQLVHFRPRRVVYVSCEPATQARDARFLHDHGYDLKNATPFDLFPQTRHIESVLTFDLRTSYGPASSSSDGPGPPPRGNKKPRVGTTTLLSGPRTPTTADDDDDDDDDDLGATTS